MHRRYAYIKHNGETVMDFITFRNLRPHQIEAALHTQMKRGLPIKYNGGVKEFDRVG